MPSSHTRPLSGSAFPLALYLHRLLRIARWLCRKMEVKHGHRGGYLLEKQTSASWQYKGYKHVYRPWSVAGSRGRAAVSLSSQQSSPPAPSGPIGICAFTESDERIRRIRPLSPLKVDSLFLRLEGRTTALSKTEKLLDTDLASFKRLKDHEVAIETPNAALVVSEAGASGIVDFTSEGDDATARGDVMRPDPNTNIMTTKTMIPNIRHERRAWLAQDIVIASGIFAVAGKHDTMEARWRRRPSLSFTQEGNVILS